jgi:hypothetical protein
VLLLLLLTFPVQGLEHDPSDELSSSSPHAAAAMPQLSVLGSLLLGDVPETPSMAIPGAPANVQQSLMGGKARFRCVMTHAAANLMLHMRLDWEL